MLESCDINKLVGNVVELTQKCGQGSFVALYAYGSYVGKKMDEWSDIDLCVIRESTDFARDRYREWLSQIGDTFHNKLDAIGIPIDIIGSSAPWDISFVLHSLCNESELLMGKDVRSLIIPPQEHKLRLSSVWVALSSVRRLCSIPRELPFPSRLPDLDPSQFSELPSGNEAWQIYSAAMHLLRAILFVEKSDYCDSKLALCQKLEIYAEDSLALACHDAIAVRAKAPRYGICSEAYPLLLRIAQTIPDMVARLLNGLEHLSLKDPSYEPEGPLYNPDGTPRF